MAGKFLLLLKKVSLFLGILSLGLLSPMASALDIGFEIITRGGVSDNLYQDLPNEELDGGIGLAELGVFGQHSSQAVEAGFLGEFALRRRYAADSDDADGRDDTTTLTRFFGSAEFNVTRSFSWFFGNVLGGTRDGDSVAVSDDDDDEIENRRNVLVTGPVLDFQLDSVRQMTGHLFFIDNSDSIGTEFSDFYEAEIAYQQELSGGLTWGLKLDNLAVRAGEDSFEPDFNRTTLGLTGTRSRDTARWTAFLGATSYQSEGDAEFETVGVSARLRYDRDNTDTSSLYAEVSRAVVDQALNETQSLLTSSAVDSPESPGIFNDTVLKAGYQYIDSLMAYGVDIGFGMSDYEAIFENGSFVELNGDEEDQNRFFTTANFYRVLTPKINLNAGLGYSKEENTEGDDFNESIFGSVSLSYKISTSFSFTTSYFHGIRDGFDSDSSETPITDSTENRVFFSLIYAPPTRAKRDQAARLRSLLF